MNKKIRCLSCGKIYLSNNPTVCPFCKSREIETINNSQNHSNQASSKTLSERTPGNKPRSTTTKVKKIFIPSISLDVIHKNPFRILGLPVSASTREITKRVSDLEMCGEIGKVVSYETDYPFLSPIERTTDVIREASNQIETMESRFFYSLFWFWEGNSADELAFEVLKDAKIYTAIRLWEKQLSSSMSAGSSPSKQKSLLTCYEDFKTLSSSYSSAKNLSILYMALARNHKGNGNNNGEFSFENFSKGVRLAGKVMNADFLSKYAKLIPDKHFIFENDVVVGAFVDEIIRTIEPLLDKSLLPDFIENFSDYPDKVKRQVSRRFTAKDIEVIENAITLSETHLKDSPEKGALVAKTLCNSTKKAIASLCKILGTEDYSYQGYADKLALAIDACGTEYYNYHFDNETGIDPGEVVLRISKYARGLAASIGVKNRIDEGIEIVTKWVEGKPERDKQKKVAEHIEIIVSSLNDLPEIDDISENAYQQLLPAARMLLVKCRGPLNYICNIFGEEDDTYLRYSSVVVNSVMGMCIKYADETRELEDVVEIFKTIADLDMDEETAISFRENREIFIRNCEIKKNLDPITEILNKLNTEEVSNPLQQAKDLLQFTATYLENLQDIDSELWLDVSSAVVNTSLNLCVQYANESIDISAHLSDLFPNANKPIDISAHLSELLLTMNKLEELAMTPELRKRFDENHKNLKNNLKAARNSYTSYIPSRRRRGCYIATMVYGDYDAPQVRVLRRFRDEVLSQVVAGRLFIGLYYWLSPGFVKYFGRFKVVHQGFRYVIDQIVRRLA